MGLDDSERVEVTSRAAWRAWLEAHHERTSGVWLVTWKKHVPAKHVSWPEVVKEALCFGWIDSRTRRVDDDRTMVWVTPRRTGSPWSALNKGYIEELEQAGLLTPAGRALIQSAKADGSWSFLDDVEALVEPDDLSAALDEDAQARRFWDELAGSLRKRALHHIKVAKTAPTRSRRIGEIVRRCAEGERPM